MTLPYPFDREYMQLALTASALVGLLSDTNRDIRKHAVEALGEIGPPVAVSGLTRALQDRDAEVRRAAVEALGESKERN